jgi:hypothetical protein
MSRRALTLVLRPRGAPSEHSREDMPPGFAWLSPEQPEQVRTNAFRTPSSVHLSPRTPGVRPPRAGECCIVAIRALCI